MKVELNFLNQNRYQNKNFTLPEKSEQKPQVSDYVQYSYPQIYFWGKINPKKLETVIDEKKLLKELNDILKENLPIADSVEEILLRAQRRMLSIQKKMENYMNQCDNLRWLKESNKVSRQSAYEHAKRMLKEIKQATKFEVFTESLPKKDEKTDYELISKFKTAVENDRFNFTDIFKEHYKGLENITSVKELKELYPSISIPERPENVIADKLEDTLTRDFYEGLYETIKNKDREAFLNMIKVKISELLDNHFSAKSEEEADFYILKLSIPLFDSIAKRLEKIVDANSLTFIPEQRKLKKNLIANDDIRLLHADYDDFVLSVIKEQYLNLKNPNEIVYVSGNTKIKVSSLKDLAYKFDKIPTRTKSLISDAENIRTVQRSYDSYLPEHFHKRLEFYGDRLSDSEELLENIIDFSTCKFEPEDISMLKKFLSGLDSVWDGKISVKEFLQSVRNNRIKPTGTEKLNRLEHQKAMEAMRAEQKKLAILKNEQEKFDNFIELLYKNKMNFIAELCSSYRPESLDKEALAKAHVLINSLPETGQFNTERVRMSLFRKVTYLDYSDTASPVFEAAQKYAKDKNGNIDIEKIGQYIINHDIIEQYPKSMQYVKNGEIAEMIIKHFQNDKESAIRYLCKYDNYSDLSPKEKSKISKISDIFDIKQTLDKNILKKIIEDDYILSDTSAKAIAANNANKTGIATISANAKQQIYDYYKFPKCIEYFRAFEDALSKFALSKNSSGIKRLDKENNALKDIIELKIMGYPDRLFSYNGTYYFDTFSNTGLH